MANISINISGPTASSNASGTITDPVLIAKARDILDALTDTAAEPPATEPTE